jgi:hypothetical protein
MIGIRPLPLLKPNSALATLYNTIQSGGSGFLFFFLIVFISTFLRGWKTGSLLWIPAIAPLKACRYRFAR